MRMTTTAIVAVVVVVAAAALLAGVVDLSSLRSREPSTAGLVAVPSAALRIPAYTRVRRDHLWDARNGQLAVIYLPPRAVTKEMLVNIADVIGRVLESDKEPGYVFTDADFLPRGTREGIVAGIPAGKRALRIAADKVEGLFGLRAGDRFDILATLPIDAAGSGRQAFNLAGPYSQELALQAQLSNWNKQATVRVIVQSAVIVQPMTARGAAAGAGREGAVARAPAVQEAVIAVDPEEVALLTEAMAVDATLTGVPRSGRPDDPVDSRTPDLRPVSPFRTGTDQDDPGSRLAAEDDGSFAVVETIMGQKRSLTAVPRP
jgi:Flp pilus assembly protein CpaB